MYRIRLPSGREAEFATIEELALALQRGEVSRDARIYHRRTDAWVPIEQHPRFQGKVEAEDSEGADEGPGPRGDTTDGMIRADALPSPEAPTSMAAAREDTPAASAPIEPQVDQGSPETAPEAVVLEPVAPTPVEAEPVAPTPDEAESAPTTADAVEAAAPKGPAATPPGPTPAPPDPPAATYEPVAPTPMPRPAPAPPTAPAPIRTHATPPVAPTPYPVRSPTPPAPPPAAPPLAPRPAAADATRVSPRRDEGEGPRRSGMLRRLARLFLIAAVAAGAYYGWNRWGNELLAGRASPAPGFETAPPPSTLLREVSGDSAAAPSPAPAVRTARPDPRAPVSVDELIARHAATFAASRQQLAAEMETIGFPNVFSPISFASPLGARAARRRIASGLNVIGQFHRRSVLLDQAYGDTASFQAGRAWSAADRDRWDSRPTLREPYASADLAESLLADADSLLAILGNAPQFELREDTVAFGDPVRAAAYDAQRRRLLERIGPPVEDFDRRPTLYLVRRSLDPARPPAPLP